MLAVNLAILMKSVILFSFLGTNAFLGEMVLIFGFIPQTKFTETHFTPRVQIAYTLNEDV